VPRWRLRLRNPLLGRAILYNESLCKSVVNARNFGRSRTPAPRDQNQIVRHPQFDDLVSAIAPAFEGSARKLGQLVSNNLGGPLDYKRTNPNRFTTISAWRVHDCPEKAKLAVGTTAKFRIFAINDLPSPESETGAPCQFAIGSQNIARKPLLKGFSAAFQAQKRQAGSRGKGHIAVVPAAKSSRTSHLINSPLHSSREVPHNDKSHSS
jgi:hypothetical protein